MSGDPPETSMVGLIGQGQTSVPGTVAPSLGARVGADAILEFLHLARRRGHPARYLLFPQVHGADPDIHFMSGRRGAYGINIPREHGLLFHKLTIVRQAHLRS